ncbi:MAG: VWA domain-containing protein [Legionellales bacterium]|nr:VWA domain-containing protein [Legionellales bacterium]
MINLATPFALLLLPVPWLIRRFLLSKPQPHTLALKIPFFATLRKLSGISSNPLPSKSWRHHLEYIIWFLLVFSLSGPQWLGKPITTDRSGHNIMLAIDLSGSMSLPDFTLNNQRYDRLSVVKQVAGNFIQQREGDRVGLIFFGTKAYMRTPLTFDLTAVKHALDTANIGLAGQMTAIGDAIGLGIKRLQHFPANSRMIILLTDGASNIGEVEPLQAAELAAAQQVKIYTIGIGSEHLEIPTLFGPQEINPSLTLDTETLQKIADITHGQFFRARDTQALKNIYQKIDELEPVDSQQSIYRPIKPLYPYPLALALLLLFCLCLTPFRLITQWEAK